MICGANDVSVNNRYKCIMLIPYISPAKVNLSRSIETMSEIRPIFDCASVEVEVLLWVA